MQLKMLFAKWRPFCLGLNVLKERERLSLSAFLGTEDIVVDIVHISYDYNVLKDSLWAHDWNIALVQPI